MDSILNPDNALLANFNLLSPTVNAQMIIAKILLKINAKTVNQAINWMKREFVGKASPTALTIPMAGA